MWYGNVGSKFFTSLTPIQRRGGTKIIFANLKCNVTTKLSFHKNFKKKNKVKS